MAERPKGYGMTAELREKVSNAVRECVLVYCGAVSWRYIKILRPGAAAIVSF